jgi:WG containing repeat
MRNQFISSVFFLLSFFMPFHLKAQAIADTIKKYPNGNILLQRNGLFELKSKSDSLICNWNAIETNFNNIKNEIYKKIRKTENGSTKRGIFNSENGTLIIPLIYDNFIPLDGKFQGVIITSLGKKFGLFQLMDLTIVPTIYKNYFFPPNGTILLAKDTVAYMFNSKLVPIDSIVGFKNFQNLYRYGNDKKNVSAIYFTHGISLIDSDNKLITFEKDWTKIEIASSGDNFIVSTKDGFGLYNINSKKNIEPCKYKSFKCKGYFNEQILFSENSQWKLFDSSGKRLLTIKTDSIIPALDEWSGFFFQRKGKWGFIDLNGKVLIKPIWKSMWNPRFDNFEATLPNGRIKHYYYEYMQINGSLIISGIREGATMAAPNSNE